MVGGIAVGNTHDVPNITIDRVCRTHIDPNWTLWRSGMKRLIVTATGVVLMTISIMGPVHAQEGFRNCKKVTGNGTAQSHQTAARIAARDLRITGLRWLAKGYTRDDETLTNHCTTGQNKTCVQTVLFCKIRPFDQ